VTNGKPAVRPVRREDAPAISALVNAAFRSYREFAPPGWQPPDPAGTVERHATGLDRPGVWGAVAEYVGEHLGHVIWLPAMHVERFVQDDPELAYLWQLFVRADRHGSGLASELLRDAVDSAARLGFTDMTLLTPTAHGRARRFYEREGWDRGEVWGVDPDLKLELIEYRRSLEAGAVHNDLR
jgi:GNAT superfamily N-acetyltransferase